MATFLALLLPLFAFAEGAVEYYGKPLGPLSSLHHGISGDVYAVDARTVHIRNFNYDGVGPAAYFYAGNTKTPSANGFIIRDEKGLTTPLKRYRNKHVTITLPEGKTLNNIKWLSVWCEEYAVNFGDVKIPKNLDVPKPQKLAALSGVHGVSSEPVVIVDAQTLLIPSFSYDGEAPDAKFWVGRGSKPSPQGLRIPDENGKESPLRRYDRKTIVLTLPGDLTVFDIGHFGVWCEAFTVDFGHIQISGNLNVPPSLKMIGVSPQSKLNCEVMDDDLGFEVRWAIAGDSIVVQLVAKLESGGYMSFGLSGEEGRNVMVGGDVVVAWVDHNTLNGYAVDYFLDAKSQCSGNRGSCPDYRIEDDTESIRLLNAALINGYSIVTYQRPLRVHDLLDKPIYTNGSQAVIWAVGPLNSKQEVSYHSLTSKGTVLLDFGRQPAWNCPIPEQDATAAMSGNEEEEINVQEAVDNTFNARTRDEVTTYKSVPPPAPVPPNKDAWDIPPIQCNEPEDGVFYAQMGPTGGKRGYSAITGHVGWGISYYINGLLIPEINVVRGKTYTFVVEGGLDPETPAKFHPFYITDDPVGGYEHKTPQEKAKIRIFAGAERNKRGDIIPTGVGRLCNWTPDPDQPPADEFASFGAYQRTLTLICDHGEPGVIQWTPDEKTPDTVYYQCFSHRYLGWKINVLDRCDLPVAAASEQVTSRVKAEIKEEDSNDELQSRPSIKVATRVLPNSYPVSENNKPSQEAYYKALAESPVNFKDGLSQAGLDAYSYQYKPDPEKNGGYQITFSNLNGYDQDYKNLGERFPHNNEEIYDTTTTKNIESSPQSIVYRVNSTTPAYFTSGSYLPSVLHTTSYPNFPLNQKQRRPPQVMTFIRPHRPVPPIMLMAQQGMALHRPMTILPSNTQHRPIVIKKPVYRVPSPNIPRPGVVPNNIISNRVIPQPTILIPSSQPHNQRPLSSQVTKSVSVSYSTAKIKKPISHYSIETSKVNKADAKKRTPNQDQISYVSYSTPVSNGFNPGTVILESGFKPIIQNNSDIQKRVSTIDDENEERDAIGVIRLNPFNEDMKDEEETEDEEKINKSEILEPIFVPSPLDSLQKPTKKSASEELSQSKKKLLAANKPVRQNLVVIRRRPMFSENAKFRSQNDDSQDEIPMAAERMDTYYLPPSGPIYGVSSDGQLGVPAKPDVEGATIVTYDGKSITGSDVASLPPTTISRGSGSKKPKSSFDLIRNTPQFAPFKGDVPPPVPEIISPDIIPQLQSRNQGRPSHSLDLQLKSQPSKSKTKLSRVHLLESEPYDSEELEPEATEFKEYRLSTKDKFKLTSAKKEQMESLSQNKSKEQNDQNQSSEEETEESSYEKDNQEKKRKISKRNKRHAHDGHNHEHDHDHDHDHSHSHESHTQGQMKTSPNSASTKVFYPIIALVTSFTLLHLLL